MPLGLKSGVPFNIIVHCSATGRARFTVAVRTAYSYCIRVLFLRVPNGRRRGIGILIYSFLRRVPQGEIASVEKRRTGDAVCKGGLPYPNAPVTVHGNDDDGRARLKQQHRLVGKYFITHYGKN